MLDASIITAAYFGTADETHRTSVCGTSASAFQELEDHLRFGVFAADVVLWMCWEGRNLDEARQRIRELH